MTKIKIPGFVRGILNTLEKGGFEAYLVGGCVRDMLLGRRVNDWDITTSALPQETVSLFRKTVPTGIKFGTVTVLHKGGKAEVTTFRTDGKYSDSRRPDTVRFVRNLNEDLARRDFTINAIAMSVNGELYDPFYGIKDLKNNLIRCVGDSEQRFGEDALRMLRAVRFSAQLGFSLDKDITESICKNGPEVARISRERVYAETVKILMSPRPERIIEAIKSGMYGKAADRIPTEKEMTAIGRLHKDATMRLCAFSACAGNNAAEFIKSLKGSARQQKLCEQWEKYPCKTEGEIRYLIYKLKEEDAFCVCGINDVKFGGNRAKRARNIAKHSPISALAVDGNMLADSGISKGRQMGEVLDKLAKYMCQHPGENTTENCIALAREYALTIDN